MKKYPAVAGYLMKMEQSSTKDWPENRPNCPLKGSPKRVVVLDLFKLKGGPSFGRMMALFD
jgi:hypothetical protein